MCEDVSEEITIQESFLILQENQRWYWLKCRVSYYNYSVAPLSEAYSFSCFMFQLPFL